MKKLNKYGVNFAALTTLALLFSSCNSGGGTTSANPVVKDFPVSLPNGTTLPTVTGANVMSITVNGSGCTNSYANKPCASVKICEPGSAVNCVTVNDLLIDTGSFGLRVFKASVSSLTLPAVTNAGSVPVAECVGFGDGSSDWGPVVSADVVLGGESAVTTPIQVIDSTYFSGHYSCGQPDVDAAHAGFNGILGVGVWAQDCGASCVGSGSPGLYYACSGGTCARTALALANQVTNPVALETTDNNGVIFELPNVTALGAQSTPGYLILGIDTRTNNVSSGVRSYAADPTTREFVTSFGGQSYTSFIDSGSNGLYFPSVLPSDEMPDCSTLGSQYSGLAGFYCPSGQVILSATNSGYTGSPSSTSDFQVVDLITLLNTGNNVLPGMAGASGSGIGSDFDWGLPFFIGRNVYVGIKGTSSNLGNGPYWGY